MSGSKSRYWRLTVLKLQTQKSSVYGFSLIEPLIASVLLVILSMQIATLFDINIRAIGNSQALDAADLEIHATIDTLRNLGTSYNWCAQPVSDPYTVKDNNNNDIIIASNNRGGSNVSDCDSAVVATPKDYYAPSSGVIEDFIGRCLFVPTSASSDKIVANLSTALAEIGASDSSNGVKITSYFEDLNLRRFKIKLERTIKSNGSNRTLTRWFYLIPDLANWCPS